MDSQRSLLRTQEGEEKMMMEKDKEENVRTPLDKMTASTVNHARKLSKRLRQIQQGEVLSNGCDKNVDSDAGDYLTLVVSDEIADTEQADKTSKLDAGKNNQKDFRGSFDGLPRDGSINIYQVCKKL